jgi:O-antigen/teichoic acid export membrane protein
LLLSLNFQSSSSKVLINLLGRVITALAGIIFVPVYIRIIGAESYGLVAFYGTLAGALIVLDLGLSIAVSRRVSILKVQHGKEKDLQDLVFSVSIIYWIVALLAGAIIILLAHPIATYWVKAKDLPIPVIKRSVILMGFVFAFQFPSSVYNGVMMGLEKQIPGAIATSLFSILKAIGVIAILKLVSPTIEAYFVWQAIVSLVFIVLLHFLVKYYLLPTGQKAIFSAIQLRTIRRFAAGMTGISLITFFLGQVDKILVSKLLLLEFVGYYNLAFMVASAMTLVIAPLQNVIFPRFSSLVAENKHKELLILYHKSCRWIAIVIFPVGFTLIFFAREILLLWTKNPVLSQHTAPILRVFAAGTICNCMMWMPYFFMLAKGNTKFTIYQNFIASVVLVPLLFWWTIRYGALGASFVWLTVNAGYIIFSLPLFHRLYLKGELCKWYKNDVALPFLSAGLLVLGAKYLQIQKFFTLNVIHFGIMIITISLIYTFIIPELRKYYNHLFETFNIIWRNY